MTHIGGEKRGRSELGMTHIGLLLLAAAQLVAAQRPAGCSDDTGGTCAWFSCNGWRDSECRSDRCKCASNKCAWGGKCCLNGQVESGRTCSWCSAGQYRDGNSCRACPSGQWSPTSAVQSAQDSGTACRAWTPGRPAVQTSRPSWVNADSTASSTSGQTRYTCSVSKAGVALA